MGIIVLSCATNEPILENNENIKIDQEIKIIGDARFYDNESSAEAMKKDLEETNNTSSSKATTERKGKGNGNVNTGKPQKIITFGTSIKSNPLRIAALGRIMAEPVEYLGVLPTEQTVDWDNDGVLDVVEIVKRCYFPRTFIEIKVNDVVVSYHVTYESLAAGGVQIVGFTDVDNDGFQDIIFEGGNPRDYNNSAPYIPYNVGFNREGEPPLSLAEIVQSLVITSIDQNPDFIHWDLSPYGYDFFVFHVFLTNISRNDGYGNTQTTTYGEHGFSTKDRIIVGDTYEMSFTNLGENCEPIKVLFII